MSVTPDREVALARKARGAFFTPEPLTRFISRWAIRDARDAVLEPSCGEAAFLASAADRLSELGVDWSTHQLHGVELHKESAASARGLLRERGVRASIEVGDFFDHRAVPSFDAVIGNPPYIRYHGFTGAGRAAALKAALAQGVRLNGLANAWAAFTVHAAACLRPGGRLGLVLPAELMSVGYAAPIRSYLLKRFGSIKLVLFGELVFPDALEEVVLLLAEGEGGADAFEVHQVQRSEDLQNLDLAHKGDAFQPAGVSKWTEALLPTTARAAYRQVLASDSFTTLAAWGATSLGLVTGANDFFCLSEAQRTTARLAESDLVHIAPPGTRYLRGLEFSASDWENERECGSPVFLLHPGRKPSAAARRYIASGERAGTDQGYKCRARNPWWSVPMVGQPDLLLTYMDHERPRLVLNSAGALPLNSLYGIKLREGAVRLGRRLLPLASVNSATLLSGELAGRSYGGGILKLEPREADCLLLPSLEAMRAVAAPLREIEQTVDKLLRGGELLQAVGMVDKVLVDEGVLESAALAARLRDGWRHLFDRRTTRARTPNAKRGSATRRGL